MFIGKLVYMDGYICISRLQCLKMCKFSLNMKKNTFVFHTCLDSSKETLNVSDKVKVNFATLRYTCEGVGVEE